MTFPASGANVPELPPNVLASADQWLASSTESLAGPLAKMRDAIAAPDTENRLANVAIGLANQAHRDPLLIHGMAAAYVLALYELARVSAKLDAAQVARGGSYGL